MVSGEGSVAAVILPSISIGFANGVISTASIQKSFEGDPSLNVNWIVPVPEGVGGLTPPTDSRYVLNGIISWSTMAQLSILAIQVAEEQGDELFSTM